MKTKLKPFLILLFTLVIGIAIGFEISEILIKIRFEEMKVFKEPKSFVKIFEDILLPEPGQKPVIDSILVKYHIKMEAITKKGMAEVSVTMDSMKNELKTVVNEDQFKRLEEEMSRMKHMPPPRERAMPPNGNRMPPPRDRHHMDPHEERPMPPPEGNGQPPQDFSR
jgi:hypothetical protein